MLLQSWFCYHKFHFHYFNLQKVNLLLQSVCLPLELCVEVYKHALCSNNVLQLQLSNYGSDYKYATQPGGGGMGGGMPGQSA